MQLTKEVEKLVSEDRTGEAITYLFNKIKQSVAENQLQEAENYRDMMYEVDSMALSEIVKASDLIDETKNSAMDETHLKLWDDLYSRLTDNERNSFYYALKKETIQRGDYLVRQFKKNSRLYFIESGDAGVIHKSSQGKLNVRKLGPGDLAGNDTFIPVSLSFTFVTALSDMVVRSLDREFLTQWEKTNPGIENILDSFCRHTPGSGLDEASSATIMPDHNPVPVDCSSKLQIVRRDDTPLGKPMRGTIAELSPIGAVIMIKKIKHETARQILGKKIKIAFTIPAKEEKTARLKGAIMKIESHMFSDNSIFIRFDKKLSDNIVQFMGNLKKKEG